MYNRSIARLAILTGLVSIVAALPLAAGDADSWIAPRTPDGKPDLQGVWANNNATPLERPEQLADKSTLSDEELAEFKERAAKIFNDEADDAAFGDSVFRAALSDAKSFTSTDAKTGNYNQFWVVEREFSDKRTSLVIDPPNGRIPALTPSAQQRADVRRVYRREHPADSWLDRSTSDRCLLGFNAGPPLNPGGYNQNLQIFQTPDYVVLLTEMVHTVRVVPLDGRSPLGDEIRQWSGDARGYWEGDTLVVETSNLKVERRWRNSTANMKLIERFTRVDADTLEYRYTVTDPETWTSPWTVSIPLQRTDVPMYEYACHEGNHSMYGILAGQRVEDAAAGR